MDVLITTLQLRFKRLFDLFLTLLLLPIMIPILFILVVIAAFDVGKFGWFQQVRVGQHGTVFSMYKIRTLKAEPHYLGQLDQSASSYGRYLRRSKLDELPQLFNVLFGHMSFVGPRPDVPGFADVLTGDDRIILKVKPGVTGPATLKYHNEEQLLVKQSDPETYNRTIIWVDKVEINKKYVQNWSFFLDLIYILQSIF
jgi:lipopolysaccharide/colanic/teichoic acid biosynthesis glycosyltransferase